MGSLPASGIPVVAKQPLSFRKSDIRIKSTDNRDDTITVVTANRPALSRPIGSGSIVRDSGVVSYFEEKVVGTIRMARTSDERIASDANGARQVVVDLGDGQTIAVIESGLAPTTPQKWALNAGDRVVRQDSTDDTTIDRIG
jgi:hypothetical protein